MLRMQAISVKGRGPTFLICPILLNSLGGPVCQYRDLVSFITVLAPSSLEALKKLRCVVCVVYMHVYIRVCMLHVCVYAYTRIYAYTRE